MIAENPLALAYILADDVYLLPDEKQSLAPVIALEQPVSVPEPQVTLKAEEPIVAYNPPILAEEPVIQQSPAMPQATAPTITETPVLNFNYIGGYQKKFLIVVHYPDYDMMAPDHLNALESAIKRRGLSLDEIAIFNIAKQPEADLKAIGRFFKPQKMLLLGKNTIPAGLETPVLNLLTKLGKCDMLYSFSFDEMMGNKENTKAFWEQMKIL